MTAQYTYLTVDAVTGSILSALPLRSVSFSRPLSAPGAFTGVLDLGDPRILALDPSGSTLPARTLVYVDRDGTLLWSGMLWSRTYDSSTRQLTLDAGELESYFARRLIRATYNPAGVDQLTIVQTLVSTALAAAQSPQVNVASGLSGVTQTRTWNGYELKTVQTGIKDTGTLLPGFDWSFDPSYIAGHPATTFNQWFPGKGSAAPLNGLLFELPGNIVSYKLPEDGSSLDVMSWFTGAGTAGGQLQASTGNAALLAAGYPMLESVGSDSSISDQPSIAARSAAQNLASGAPVSLLSLTVRADQDPVLGAYSTGDQVRVRITDARFPAPVMGGAGAELTARIMTMTVTPPEAGTPESVVLTLDVTNNVPSIPFTSRSGVS